MPNYLKSYRENKSLLVHQKQKSVDKYERCRYIPSEVIGRFIDILLEGNPKSIIDAGVGNGRFFIPLSKRAKKSELFGIDISQAMLDDLSKKVSGGNIHLYLGDLRDKESFKGKVDAIYVYAVLHILSERWEDALDNMINSISKKGKIILGEEINSIFHGSENIYEEDSRLKEINNLLSDDEIRKDIKKVESLFKRYHELRKKYGLNFKRVNNQMLHGDQSSGEDYIKNKGFSEETIKGEELCWLKPHTIRGILDSIKEGTVTTLGSDMPDDVREKIVKELEVFCKEKEYDLNKIMQIPCGIHMHIFRIMDKEDILKEVNEKLKHKGYTTNYFKDYGLSDLFIGEETLGPEMSWISPQLTIYILENKELFRNKEILDMGTGSGVQAVALSLSGAKFVTATDISDCAIKSINENIKSFNIKNVRVIKSNLFQNLKGKKFDIMVFNHPFVSGDPKDHVEEVYTIKEETINNFFKEAKNHLKKDGLIIMPFSYLGDHDPKKYSKKHGYMIEKELSFENKYGKHSIYIIKN